MVAGRAYTRDTVERDAVALTTRWHCSKVTGTFERGSHCARRRVTRCGGARPSRGPLPGLPVSQRPLQEDQSRCAMHVLVCVFACVATYVSDPLGPPGAVGS